MNSAAELSELLPGWVLYGPFFYWVPVALLFTWGSIWATCRILLRPLRKAAERHWTEQARLLFSARLAVTMGAVVAVTLAVLVPSQLAQPEWPLSSPRLLGVSTSIAALLGVMLGSGELVSLLRGRSIPFRQRLRHSSTFLLLLAPHVVVFLVLLSVMPSKLGPRAWVTFGLGILGMGLAVRFSGLPLLLRLGLARPASRKVVDLVTTLTTERGLRPVPCFEVELGSANALALVFSRQLVFSSELVAAFSPEELHTVAAHELAHLNESKSVKVSRATAAFILAPFGLLPAIETSSLLDVCILLGLLLCVLLLVRWLQKLAQRMEVRADRQAKDAEALTGSYARTLEKLYELNRMPAVVGRRRLHPDLYDRMLAAGVEPTYTRPAAPRRFYPRLVVAGFAAIGWLTAAMLPMIAARFLPPPLAQHVEMAALGPSFRQLAELSDYYEAQGDVARARELRRQAVWGGDTESSEP